MARLVLITLGLVVLLHLGAAAQVDTLRFEEINNFSVADQIYNTYFQDINNDNLPEMIICEANLVEVYNPLNGNLLWSSPPLGHNSTTWQAQFGDLNGDGYPDLVAIDPSATDTSYIKIFDVNHDRLIWNSPNYYHLPKICAIGDRNSDGVNDIIVFTRGGIHYQNIDTAWVDIYDGPVFQLSAHQEFSILSDHYTEPEFDGNTAQRSETFNKAAIINLSSNGQSLPKIVLFLNMSEYCSTYDGMYYFNYNLHKGNYRIFDPANLNNISITGYGGMQSYSSYVSDQDETDVSSYTEYAKTTNISDPYGGYNQWFYHTLFNSEILSADGSLINTNIWNYDSHNSQTTCWSGTVGNFDRANEGDEICLGVVDSIRMFSFPTGTPLWTSNLANSTFHQFFLFQIDSILGPPQILCTAPYNHPLTYNGTTGEFTGIFPYDDFGSFQVSDLNNDGNDEVAKFLNGETEVRIYRIINVTTGINDRGQIPSKFKLYPAYPNPFNASTTIQYDLIKDSPVKIGIYDILGQRVATLINQTQPAGHHQVIWNAKDVSSGIYFYNIQAGDYEETKKMVLLK